MSLTILSVAPEVCSFTFRKVQVGLEQLRWLHRSFIAMSYCHCDIQCKYISPQAMYACARNGSANFLTLFVESILQGVAAPGANVTRICASDLIPL